MSERNYVLFEFQESFNTDRRNQNKLKFKKLTEQAKAPRKATEGFVGYDLYDLYSGESSYHAPELQHRSNRYRSDFSSWFLSKGCTLL